MYHNNLNFFVNAIFDSHEFKSEVQDLATKPLFYYPVRTLGYSLLPAYRSIFSNV
ncbi:hypothetical protein DET47_10291 [Shewanella putrefaciens]|nr:hypothetical protein DET47_10291 [Shewanella putrefaciens]